MDRLIVINYEGDHFKNDNHKNLMKNFAKDSGLEPILILEQPTKEKFISELNDLNFDECNKLIIHIKSHGFEDGIIKLDKETSRIGDETTLISWSELISIFNSVSEICNTLFINLGTVCNSSKIYTISKTKKFKSLTTNTTVSNPVEPRKINKLFLKDQLETAMLSDVYLIK